MWLSRQIAAKPNQQEQAAMGQISVAGETPAAVTTTEHRNLRLVCPGGYAWSPTDGQRVLLLRGSAQTVLGQSEPSPVELSQGEVCLYAAGCNIILRNNGEIHLNGRIFCNGVEIKNER